MKPFYASKTFWLNMASLPAAALLTPVVGADTALKATVAKATTVTALRGAMMAYLDAVAAQQP